ncbi:MAG: hypothetical protein IIT33_01365, partial [Prevotella sp.]|nr:hypothetical protein [Prevotella sp.]
GQNLTYGMCTLGFITSALIGGPLGRYLIKKYNLKANIETSKENPGRKEKCRVVN